MEVWVQIDGLPEPHPVRVGEADSIRDVLRKALWEADVSLEDDAAATLVVVSPAGCADPTLLVRDTPLRDGDILSVGRGGVFTGVGAPAAVPLWQDSVASAVAASPCGRRLCASHTQFAGLVPAFGADVLATADITAESKRRAAAADMVVAVCAAGADAFVLVEESGAVRTVDAATGGVLNVSEGLGSRVWAAAMSPCAALLALGTRADEVLLLACDAADSSQPWRVLRRTADERPPAAESAAVLAFAGQGRLFHAGSHGGDTDILARVVDDVCVDDGGGTLPLVARMPVPSSGFVACLASSAAGEMLLAGSSSGDVVGYDPVATTLLFILRATEQRQGKCVLSLACNPVHGSLFYCSWEGMDAGVTCFARRGTDGEPVEEGTHFAGAEVASLTPSPCGAFLYFIDVAPVMPSLRAEVLTSKTDE